MESKGKGIQVGEKPRRDAVVETNIGNASTVERPEDQKSKNKLGTDTSMENRFKKPPSKALTKIQIQPEKKVVGKKASFGNVGKVSTPAQKTPPSIPGGSKEKGSKDQPESAKQPMQHQHQRKMRPSSPQHEQPQNTQRKRPRKLGSLLQTQLEQTQRLSKTKVDKNSVTDVWKRYDLTKSELTTAHEVAELEAVKKKIWKRKKYVPYKGFGSFHSSSFLA